MQWVEKYRPKKFEDIKEQDLAVEKIKVFVKYFGTKKKAMILHGPPGVGKTTIAHIIASEINSEIFELNASDLRNKEKLNGVLKPAIEQISLTKKGKIILIDEVDGISAVDRGGLTELLSLIKTTTYPIIITANDIWDKKLSELRKNAELVPLKEVSYRTIKDILFDVLRKEKLFIDQDIITSIAIKAKGDIRAAVNDMQVASNLKDYSGIVFDERDKEVDVFNALRMIFKGKPAQEVIKVFDSVNMPLDDLILWIEENIPKEYKGKELARAYDLLSKVDVFRGRIYKQQYWRFLIYENFFLSYGISSAKKEIKAGFTSYQKPSRILKIWMNNQKIEKKKLISQKYAKYVHIGKKRALKEFPIIKQIINSDANIAKELKLTEEEIIYLGQ